MNGMDTQNKEYLAFMSICYATRLYGLKDIKTSTT